SCCVAPTASVAAAGLSVTFAAAPGVFEELLFPPAEPPHPLRAMPASSNNVHGFKTELRRIATSTFELKYVLS
ncbi:MAG: hypothetical protein ACRD1A_08230, partial [Terriglobales bacterium]